MLVSSGMSSVVERVLLASTQQRQAPTNTVLLGFSMFIADGIKLFSKLLTPSTNAWMTGIAAVFFFSIAFLFDMIYSKSCLEDVLVLQILIWLLVAIVEMLGVSTLTSVQSSYLTLAFSRSLEMLLFCEVALSVLVIIFLSCSNITSSNACMAMDSSMIVVGILFLVLQMQFERVPFDVVEAESELIDGVTVELEGFVFSLAYAGEVVCFLIVLKMLLVTSGFSVVVLCFLIFYSFIGSIALARLLLADIVEALLAMALTAAPMMLAILSTSRLNTYKLSIIIEMIRMAQ